MRKACVKAGAALVARGEGLHWAASATQARAALHDDVGSRMRKWERQKTRGAGKKSNLGWERREVVRIECT